MLGPDGVDALREVIVGFEATINGLRALLIGLAISNVATFAIVLGMWQKLNPAEVAPVQQTYPKITGGLNWPTDPDMGDLHLGMDSTLYRWEYIDGEDEGWFPILRSDLFKGTVGGGA